MKKIISFSLSVVLICATFFGVFSTHADAGNSSAMKISVDTSKIYKDISSDAWYKKAVDIAESYKLIDGVSETEFAPDKTSDRATLITALWRMTGRPSSACEIPFTDVELDWYRDSVKWAYENKIANGMTETEFNPGQNVTRAQLAAFLFRYMSYMGGDTSNSTDITAFPDSADVQDWAIQALSWACAEKIITGSVCSDGVTRLLPNEGATRAQLATMIMRFCENYSDIFKNRDNAEEDDDYLNIKHNIASTYERKNYGVRSSDYVLSIRMSKNWKFTKQGKDGFVIIDNGEEIGSFSLGVSEPADSWKIVSERSKVEENLTVKEYTEKYGSGVYLRFRMRYQYEYTENGKKQNFTLVSDYNRTTTAMKNNFFDLVNLEAVSQDPGFGKLSDLKGGRLLILGNSFIASSSVGGILSEMFVKNNKNCHVDAYARAYASVETYINDDYLMSEIRRGVYDAVFMCGFYHSGEVTKLATMKSACDASGTKLVIFPAHNESRAAIDEACEKYPELTIVDWKGEIDALLNIGKPKNLFCIDDSHLHSTTLAGYVGAHMIYRSIYGENPKAPVSNIISQSEVDAAIGEYKNLSKIRLIGESQIVYFD